MSWLDQHAAAVQAICAVLGIIGLICYCYLTWELRSTAIRQATASQRPLLVLFKPDEDVSSGHFIRNMGNGPAMDIYWKVGITNVRDNSETIWNLVGTVAASDRSDLPNWSRKESQLTTMAESGIRIHYGDLEGNYYCLTARPTQDDFSDAEITILQVEGALLKKDCMHRITR